MDHEATEQPSTAEQRGSLDDKVTTRNKKQGELIMQMDLFPDPAPRVPPAPPPRML